MRRPPAPPSSKSAQVFLKRGSTANSRSGFLFFKDDGSWASVAPFVRFRFLVCEGPPSGLSESPPSSSTSLPPASRLLRSFPVSVPTLSTRLVQIFTHPSRV